MKPMRRAYPSVGSRLLSASQPERQGDIARGSLIARFPAELHDYTVSVADTAGL
jgi:hypothetical protein